MAKYKSEDLISTLQEDMRRVLRAADHFRSIDIIKLGLQPAEGRWSVAQVLEHLNLFDRYYLPHIERELSVVDPSGDAWFEPGFWGDYMARAMQPKDVFEVKKGMSTYKPYRPARTLSVEAVMTEFAAHGEKTIGLLERAKGRNLNTVRIPFSVSKLVRLRLGDVFRILVAHKQRHMIQARNNLRTLGLPTDRFPVILEVTRH